jgi:hypothetical protein
VKWHISEECFCRGFKLKPVRGHMKCDGDEKATFQDESVTGVRHGAKNGPIHLPEQSAASKSKNLDDSPLTSKLWRKHCYTR